VISGRSLDDVTRRFEGIPVWYIFGNFGHEPVPYDCAPPTRIIDWARHLVAQLPADRGLVVEEKRYSVTIHYRRARNKRWALKTIEEAISPLTDARVFNLLILGLDDVFYRQGPLLAAADPSHGVAILGVVMMNALFLIGLSYRVMTKRFAVAWDTGTMAAVYVTAVVFAYVLGG
jgi:hypothetical protein